MGEDDELREELDAVLKLDDGMDDGEDDACKTITAVHARNPSRSDSGNAPRAIPAASLPSFGVQAAISLIEAELDDALANSQNVSHH